MHPFLWLRLRVHSIDTEHRYRGSVVLREVVVDVALDDACLSRADVTDHQHLGLGSGYGHGPCVASRRF